MSADINANNSNSLWSLALRSPRYVLGGGALFLFALSLLLNNETKSKRSADALWQAKREVVQTDTPIAANDGKLVAVKGRLKSTKRLIDPDFDVESKAIALKREVLMYQWIEYQHTEGSGRRKRTVYDYELGWSAGYQDSTKFHEPNGHTNPAMKFRSRVIMADDARLGDYVLADAELFNQALPSELDQKSAEFVQGSVVASDLAALAQPLASIPELSNAMSDQGWTKMSGSRYYKGAFLDMSGEPALGDLIVSFSEIPVGSEMTLIGKQQSQQIVPWKANSGDQCALFN
jgi:Transmembrane protein 43